MKLRNLILLGSLVLLASCVTRTNIKASSKKGRKTEIKLSMASNMSELPIPGDALPHWSMIGKCDSGFDLKLSNDNRALPLNDKCSFSLQSLGPIQTKIENDANAVPRSFVRHRTEKDSDHHEHPVFFLSTDNKLGFWARLTTENALNPVQEDSTISYVITSVSHGKDLTAQLEELELEQLSFKGMEPPRFAAVGLSAQALEHGIAKVRVDLQCVGDRKTFTLVAPDRAKKVAYDGAADSLQAAGRLIGAARKALEASSETLNARPAVFADIKVKIDAAQAAIVQIFPAIPGMSSVLEGLEANVPPAYAWASSMNDIRFMKHSIDVVRHIAVEEAAAKHPPIASCDDPSGVDHKLQAESAQQLFEKCLDRVGGVLSKVASLVGLDKWKCDTNSLKDISYRFASDSYRGGYGQLSISDLDQIMTGVPLCDDPENNKTLVHPEQRCRAYRINETVDGFLTVFVHPPTAHHTAHTSSLLVIKAEGPLLPDGQRDYSYSYSQVKWKNYQHGH